MFNSNADVNVHMERRTCNPYRAYHPFKITIRIINLNPDNDRDRCQRPYLYELQ